MSKYGVFSGPYFPAFGLNIEWTKYFSVFSPNVGKCGPKKLRIWTHFTQCILSEILWKNALRQHQATGMSYYVLLNELQYSSENVDHGLQIFSQDFRKHLRWRALQQ